MAENEGRQVRDSKKRRKIRAKRWLILFVTALVIVFIACNWEWLSPVAILQRVQAAKSGAGVVTEYPVDIAGKEVAGISGFGSGGILAADSGCYLLRSDSTTYYQYALASTTAVIGDKAALVYEKGGTKFQYFNTEGRVFEYENAEQILRMAVAKNGSYALLTAPSEYSSKLTIYSNTHTELFSQFFQTPNLTRIALNSSAKYCAVIVLETIDGQLCSQLSVYDTGLQDPVYTQTFAGLLALDMQYCEDGDLVIVFDRAAVRYNTKYELSWRVDFDGLAAYATSNDGTVGLLLDDSEGIGCTLKVCGEQGELWSAQISGQAKGLSVRDGKAVYLAGGQVLLLDESGKSAGTAECSLDTYSTALGDKFVVLVGKDKISRILLSDMNVA
ncbi:MAG TPA: DUF5711 family protein [Oscillospiraceae bacterium]|nr:DUF5711 family protein [Oscillospiraceae bacterium]HPK34634.1 DUF5711 family protein [Oscillospiraceae bacterium]HPR74601.1 DUF5711 family protein [Oscillospiraceae bacterium]